MRKYSVSDPGARGVCFSFNYFTFPIPHILRNNVPNFTLTEASASCQKQLSRLMTKPTMWLCAKRRLRSAWASAQSEQSLRYAHEDTFGPQLPIERTAKTLIRLDGCPGCSESSLGAQPLCLFCHEAAQFNIHLHRFLINLRKI